MKRLRSSRVHQQGFSLVEILLSLVIGLVVVGAVLVSYIGSGQTTKLQAAYSEMNENAQIGLTILARELRLGGYSAITGIAVTGGANVATFVRNYAARPVFGCDQGFASPATTGNVACVTTDTPAIEVAYDADLLNSRADGVVPTDCLGRKPTDATELAAATASGFVTVHNRFYLSATVSGRPELYCVSKFGGSPQPLVENVEAMKFWYGESDPSTPAIENIVHYVSVANLSDASFAFVKSVRICLLMRSSEQALSADDGDMKYLDCDLAEQTNAANDRYARKAYFTTVTLRNKMAL